MSNSYFLSDIDLGKICNGLRIRKELFLNGNNYLFSYKSVLTKIRGLGGGEKLLSEICSSRHNVHELITY